MNGLRLTRRDLHAATNSSGLPLSAEVPYRVICSMLRQRGASRGDGHAMARGAILRSTHATHGTEFVAINVEPLLNKRVVEVHMYDATDQ